MTRKYRDSQEYNGYTNYSTWNAALWLSNHSEGVYNEARRIAKHGTIGQLKAYVEQGYAQNIFTDEAELADVNWSEVRRSLLDR
jgi:hypothetical protein